MRSKGLLLIFFFFFALLIFPQASRAALTVKANHDHIKIDFLYHGSTVSVTGASDPGRDIVVKITSPDGHEALKQKGKMAGLLWMNLGTIEFEHVPGLYLLSSTRKIPDLLGTDEIKRLALGYDALAEQARISPAATPGEKAKWFAEFIKYKEHGEVYGDSERKVAVSPEGGRQDYSVTFDWPYQASPGVYTVSVYAVGDGKVLEQAETQVLVEQVGIVKRLSGMARENPALYGFISIISALAAGFGVGMIFRKGGGSH